MVHFSNTYHYGAKTDCKNLANYNFCVVGLYPTVQYIIPAALTFINLASRFCKVVRLAPGCCSMVRAPSILRSQHGLLSARASFQKADLMLLSCCKHSLPGTFQVHTLAQETGHLGPDTLSPEHPPLPSPHLPVLPHPRRSPNVRPALPCAPACARPLGCTWLMPTLPSSLWALPITLLRSVFVPL